MKEKHVYEEREYPTYTEDGEKRGDYPAMGTNRDYPEAGKLRESYSYNGPFYGKCGKDGFYYRDQGSFVVCSNNKAYVQQCAPGRLNYMY